MHKNKGILSRRRSNINKPTFPITVALKSKIKPKFHSFSISCQSHPSLFFYPFVLCVWLSVLFCVFWYSYVAWLILGTLFGSTRPNIYTPSPLIHTVLVTHHKYALYRPKTKVDFLHSPKLSPLLIQAWTHAMQKWCQMIWDIIALSSGTL